MYKRVVYIMLLLSLILTSVVCASEAVTVPADEEIEFTETCEVGGIVFRYPVNCELSETTLGVFMEMDGLSGQISSGSARYRDRAVAEELLVQKQGGSALQEFIVNGHTVFASESLQGEQICRTYIVVPANSRAGDDTLYIQFRWRANERKDYYVLLVEHMIAIMQ